MRILVAGATGVLGSRVTERLVGEGHEVWGTTATPARAALVSGRGARPIVLDALDERAVGEELARVRPEVVVNELTRIPREPDPRRLAEELEPNDRLRAVGGPLLVRAALEAGVRRIVAQSVAFMYAPVGGWIKREDDPLWIEAPEPFRRSVEAVRTLEAAVTGAAGIEGLVLRYGHVYGPGTAYGRGGAFAKLLERGLLPVVGDGGGLYSFVHAEDAAAATVLAALAGAPGTYNVVDDEPARASEWIPHLAAAIGARAPRHVPKMVARVVAGSFAVYAMTEQRGASSARARDVLGWKPGRPLWRAGLGTE